MNPLDTSSLGRYKDRMRTHTEYDKAAARRLRRAANLEIRAAAKEAGISHQTLRYLEAGVTVPSLRTLAKLARVYGCSLTDFFRVKGAAA